MVEILVGKDTASAVDAPADSHPELRMIVSVVRSATTGFMHAVGQHPLIAVASDSMKAPLLNGESEPDYSIYNASADRPYIVYKANFGHATTTNPALCTYNPFREPVDVERTNPLFLFRDPVQVMNSWRRQGWGNLEFFKLAYGRAVELYLELKGVSDHVRCVAYKHLGVYPKGVFPQILEGWDIPFDLQSHGEIWDWGRTSLSSSSLSYADDYRRRLRYQRIHGVHDSLMQGTQRYFYRENPVILEPSEVLEVSHAFREAYEEIVVDSADRFMES